MKRRNGMFRSVVAMFLVLVMCLGMVPAEAFAASLDGDALSGVADGAAGPDAQGGGEDNHVVDGGDGHYYVGIGRKSAQASAIKGETAGADGAMALAAITTATFASCNPSSTIAGRWAVRSRTAAVR